LGRNALPLDLDLPDTAAADERRGRAKLNVITYEQSRVLEFVAHLTRFAADSGCATMSGAAEP